MMQSNISLYLLQHDTSKHASRTWKCNNGCSPCNIRPAEPGRTHPSKVLRIACVSNTCRNSNRELSTAAAAPHPANCTTCMSTSTQLLLVQEAAMRYMQARRHSRADRCYLGELHANWQFNQRPPKHKAVWPSPLIPKQQSSSAVHTHTPSTPRPESVVRASHASNALVRGHHGTSICSTALLAVHLVYGCNALSAAAAKRLRSTAARQCCSCTYCPIQQEITSHSAGWSHSAAAHAASLYTLIGTIHKSIRFRPRHDKMYHSACTLPHLAAPPVWQHAEATPGHTATGELLNAYCPPDAQHGLRARGLMAQAQAAVQGAW
jgi:hypothetical protein